MAKPKRYLPLQGKRFYLDVQNQRQATHLERELQQLGGTVERFLSRDVTYLITSRKEVTTDSSGHPAAASVRGPLTPSSTSTALGPAKVSSAAASLVVAVTPQVTSDGPIKPPIGVPNDAKPTASSTMNRTQTLQAPPAKRCAYIERPMKEAPESSTIVKSKQWQHTKILHNFITAVKMGQRSQSAPQLRNGYRRGIEGSDMKASATASQQQLQQQHKQQLVLQPQEKLHLPALLVSRGKKLAQKAMKTQKNIGSDLLANARSWGVKIVHTDAALQYLEKKRREAGNNSQSGHYIQPVPQPRSSTPKHIGNIKLQKPFVKVEDCSQLYRPMFVQLACIPWLNTTSPGGNCPFELELLPAGPSQQQLQEQKQQQEIQIQQEKQLQQNQHHSLIIGNKRTEDNACTKAADGLSAQDAGIKRTGVTTRAPHCRPKHGYCECCCLTFQHIQSHMQNECHRSFASNDTNYAELDTLIRQLEKRNCASPTATTSSVTPESSRSKQMYQQEMSRHNCADTGAAQMTSLHSSSGGRKGHKGPGISISRRKGDGDIDLSLNIKSSFSQIRPCAARTEATDATHVGQTENTSRAPFAMRLPCSLPSQLNLSNDVMPVLSPCTLEESFSVLYPNNLEPPQLQPEGVSGTTNVTMSCQSPVAERLPKRAKKCKGKFSKDLPPSKLPRIGSCETEEGEIMMSTCNSGVGDTGCTTVDAVHSHGVRGCTDGGEALDHSLPTVDVAPIGRQDDFKVLQVNDCTVDRALLNGTEMQAEAPWWERKSALEWTDEGGIPIYLQLLQLFQTSEMNSFEGFHFDSDGAQEQREEQAVESRSSHEDHQGGPMLHMAQESGDAQQRTHHTSSGFPGDAATHSGAADSTARTSTGNRTPTGTSNNTTALCERKRLRSSNSNQSNSKCSATTAQATTIGGATLFQVGAVGTSKSSSEWDPLFPLEGQQKVNNMYDNLRNVCVDVPDQDYQAQLDAVLMANLNTK